MQFSVNEIIQNDFKIGFYVYMSSAILTTNLPSENWALHDHKLQTDMATLRVTRVF